MVRKNGQQGGNNSRSGNQGRGGGNQGQGRGGSNGRGGGNRGRGGRGGDNGGNGGGQGAGMSNLQLAFLNMIRIREQPETTQQLRARVNSSFGLIPNMQAVVGFATLGQLGYTGMTQPRVKITTRPVTPGTKYSVIGTAGALGVALTTNELPPVNTIGTLKREDKLHWVIAEPRQPGDTGGEFNWMQRPGSISPMELLSLEHTFAGMIGVIDASVTPATTAWVTAGLDVAGALRSAVQGNVRSILHCAQYFARSTCLQVPNPAFTNGRLTQPAIIALIAWLGMFINANPNAAATMSEVQASIIN
jgi:hypothetical protein